MDSGRTLARFAPNSKGVLLLDSASGGVRFKSPTRTISSAAFTAVGAEVRVEGNTYPGSVRVTASGAGLNLVNSLTIEQYLEGVLPGELPSWFSLESQKALAVAARSYALSQTGKHAEFDLCDRTCCQMYVGKRSGSPRAVAAVRATRDLCLWSGETIVCGFYSADCGGVTTRLEDVPLPDAPPEATPYLRLTRDRAGRGDFCGRSPYHRWTVRVSREELESELNSDPETRLEGSLLGLAVAERDASGRVLTIRIRQSPPTLSTESTTQEAGFADDGTKRVSGWSVRRAISPMRIKSTLFTVDEPEPGVFRFQGAGFGHGLGLCQIGADARGRAGQSFRAILAHYYPGTVLKPLPSPSAGNPRAGTLRMTEWNRSTPGKTQREEPNTSIHRSGRVDRDAVGSGLSDRGDRTARQRQTRATRGRRAGRRARPLARVGSSTRFSHIAAAESGPDRADPI